jgi:peptide/nickel transport system permease protein
VLRSKLAAVGLAVLVVMVAAALLAPEIAPADPNRQELTRKLKPPFWSDEGVLNPLGTDQLGRDVLSRMLYGLRISLLVAVLAVAVSGAIGVGLGLVAGFYGGRADTAIMRLADLQLSMPLTLVAIAVIAAVGANLTNLIVVLGITQWPLYARVVRGEALTLRGRDFVEAARARGLSEGRVVAKHVLRNASIATLTVLAVNLGFLVSGTVVIEVVFDIPGLGSLLVSAVQMRDFALVQALTLVFGTLVVLINLLSDVAYVVIDPRIRAQA